MKHAVTLLLALALALSMVTALGEVSLSETFVTPYYTLSYPQGWTAEETDVDPGENFEPLGDLMAPGERGMVVEACLTREADMEGFSLWNAGEADTQGYIDWLLRLLEEDSPTYVDTVMAGNIPFVVLMAWDDDGPYYYAETMTNGYSVCFYAYISDAQSESLFEPEAEDLALFEAMLESFRPAA